MNLQCLIRWNNLELQNRGEDLSLAEQMEAIYGADACWYRIACLQAASEVSIAVQEEKHLQTS